MAIVKFPQYLNFSTCEEILCNRYHASLSGETLKLDLQETEWISVFTACTLFTWVREIIAAGGRVTLTPPAGGSFAARFANSVDLAGAFREVGATVEWPQRVTRPFQPARLAAFQYFSGKSVADKYIQDLGDRSAAQLLLHADELPDIVSSGDFARTALRELIENAFVHGTSKACHYAAVEISASSGPRKDHPLYASLGSDAYIELGVADYSEQDIISTLLPFLHPSYQPRGTFERPHVLSDEERCLFFAFEYDSTSKPERRRERVLQLLRGTAGEIESIATGLYDVASLARYYRGQVIFRVRGIAGTIDFSQGRGLPRLYVCSRTSRKRLASMKGSLVLLRLPAQAIGTERVVAPPLPLAARHQASSSVLLNIVPSVGFQRDPDDVTVALDLERQVLSQLQSPVPRDVVIGNKKNELVVLLLDGLDLDTKAFGALLVLLSRLPRRGQGLLVVVDDSVKIDLANEQWSRWKRALASKVDWQRFPAMVIAVEDEIAVSLFGSEEHLDASVVANGILMFRRTGDQVAIAELLLEVRRQRLAEKLQLPPVCHREHLYLIESAYYTPIFFEVRQLLADTGSRRTLVYWLASLLRKVDPAYIVAAPDFIKDVVDELYSGVPASRTSVVLLESTGLIKLALSTAGQGGGKVVLLLDVLCTGRLLNRFVELAADPSKVTVITVVDARPSESSFITAVRENGTVDIPVVAALRRPIEVILDRPESVSMRDVAVVDRITHSPTRYPLPERSDLPLEDFLKKAETAGALNVGHFLRDGLHYSYFLNLRGAFSALREELDAFVQEGVRELETQAGVDLARVETYCLEADSGLFELLERNLAATQLRSPKGISKRDLIAPPTRAGRELDAVWFVLPVMASGRTMRRTLEYAAAIGVRRLHLDIIAARLESDFLLFYQKVRRYGNTVVRIRFFCALPLPAYTQDTCPVCSLKESFASASRSIGNTWPNLRRLVEGKVASLGAVPARPAVYLGLGASAVTYRGLWREASARGAFEFADRDPAARSALMKRLEEQVEVEALASAVGREPGARVFRAERAGLIAYVPEVIQEACRQWARRSEHDLALFDKQLRGFAQLAPEALREELASLLSRYRDEGAFFEALLVEGARNPALYFQAVETAAAPADREHATFLYELSQYLKRGAGGQKAAGLFALHELRWHLVRSAGWGMPLEILRMTVTRNIGDRRAIMAAYDRFVMEGFHEAERRLHLARDSGSLWPRLVRITNLNQLWNAVADAVSALEDRITSQTLRHEHLLEAIALIETKVTAFLAGLDSVAVRPGPEMREILALAHVSERMRTPARIDVARNCPSIAICRDDFLEVILLILENATAWSLSALGNETQFHFRPLEASTLVLLEVAQTDEWIHRHRLEGGFARIRELLEHSGGSLSLEHSVKPGQPFLSIRFFAWPLEVEASDV